MSAPALATDGPATDVRDVRLLVAVYAAVILSALVPLWGIRYQPLPDLSQHLAAVSVIHNLHDPRYDLARYYQTSLGVVPYWGYYALVHLLAFPLGVETANRVVLSLYAAALPAGMGLLARRLGRSAWLGLYTAPMIWNNSYTTGFVPFCIGLAALPWAIILFDRYCERPTIGRALAAALGGVAVFFCHPLPWGMWFAGCGLIGLLHRGQTLRAVAGRFVVWLVPFATGVLVLVRGNGLFMGAAASRGFEGKSHPIRQNLSELDFWAWHDGPPGTARDPVVTALIVALLVGWLALKLSARRPRLTLHGLRAEALCLVAFTAYLILPFSIIRPSYWWGVNIRFACMALMYAAICVPGEVTSWRRYLLAVPVVVSVVFAGLITSAWARANRYCAGYDDVARAIPAGSRVLPIIGQPWHAPGDRWHYAQTYYGIHQMQYGGYMPWNFDDGFPLKYRKRFPATEWRAMQFSWARHAPYYDYVMSFNKTGADLFGAHSKDVKEVAHAGGWSAWKLPGPRVDDSPGPVYPSAWAFDAGWQPPPADRR